MKRTVVLALVVVLGGGARGDKRDAPAETGEGGAALFVQAPRAALLGKAS